MVLHLIKSVAFILTLCQIHKANGADDPLDQQPTHFHRFHQQFLTMPDAAFNHVCVGTRAMSMVIISNFLSRQSVEAQLLGQSSSSTPPHYKPTLLNHLKNYYGGGGIRTLSFVAHNAIATQFLTHGQSLNPWLFTGITGLYGMLSTPFEALSTQKIHHLCEWSSGKRSTPLSYYAIIKENHRYLFRGALLNSIIYGGSWPLFMGYINAVQDDFDKISREKTLDFRHTFFYSGIWAGFEVVGLNPLFVMQRRMQQKPDCYPNVQKTFLKLLQEEGYKAFYRGSSAAFISVFTSTVIDFFILQYLWAREH